METIQLISVALTSVGLYIILQKAFETIKDKRSTNRQFDQQLNTFDKSNYVGLLNETRKQLLELIQTTKKTHQLQRIRISDLEQMILDVQQNKKKESVQKEFSPPLVEEEHKTLDTNDAPKRKRGRPAKKAKEMRFTKFELQKEMFKKLKGRKTSDGIGNLNEIRVIKDVEKLHKVTYLENEKEAYKRLYQRLYYSKITKPKNKRNSE